MAESFYNKITQKVGRGSGADRLSESIGDSAQKAGDSLKEQQAVQDYQTSQAGSELGQSLTKAAGEAAHAYGQARKDFQTNSLTNLKMAKVNELKAQIEAERNPAAQAKLIEKAKDKIQEFAGGLREEYSKLGYGGLDLEKRVQALGGEYQKMVRDTSKDNMQQMAKVQQEMFNSQLNLVTNDVARSFRTPLGDSEGVRKLFAQSEIDHGKGSIKDIITKKTIMTDAVKARTESSLSNHTPKWTLEYLKSEGPRTFLTQKEYSAYEKRALKRVADGDNHSKFIFGQVNFSKQSPTNHRVLRDKFSSDPNVKDSVSGAMVGAMYGAFEEAAKNGTIPKNLDLLREKVVAQFPGLGVNETSLNLNKGEELETALMGIYGDDEGGFQEIFGQRTIGLNKKEVNDGLKTISKAFENNKMPPELRAGIDNKRISRVLVIQAKNQKDKLTARTFRHLTESPNGLIGEALRKGTLNSHIQDSGKIFKDDIHYNGMVDRFNDDSIRGVNHLADPRQIKRMATLKAQIFTAQEDPEAWREAKPSEKYILMYSNIGQFINEEIKKNRGDQRTIGDSIGDLFTRFGPGLKIQSRTNKPIKSQKEGF